MEAAWRVSSGCEPDGRCEGEKRVERKTRIE